MHDRRSIVTVVALCSLFTSVWLLPHAAAAEGPREPVRQLAEMAIGASRIDWQPIGNSEHLALTVAGPKGFWLRKDFEAGQPASLTLFDENEQQLRDGAYTYELRAASGLVQSGHFLIKGGSFVTAPAKPPLRNVTANLTDDELIIQGNACIGEECTTTDDDFPVLRLKGQNPNILFDDVEGLPSLSSSFNDWAIRINASDVAKFSIFDVDGELTPFSILGGAPENSLFISDNGDVGIGTATPAEKLDVASGKIGIGGHTIGERTLGGTNPTDLEVNSLRNTIVNVDSDNNSTNASFSVFRNSDLSGQAVFVAREDNTVGVNRSIPSFPLHVGTDATNGNGAYVTAAGVWTNGSSRVNKENIRMLTTEDAFTALSGLAPVRYTGKNSHDGEEYLGFIAEDVPELVAMNSRQGLSPMDIIAVLTKVVQEREKTISELAGRLAQVEAALEAVLPTP